VRLDIRGICRAGAELVAFGVGQILVERDGTFVQQPLDDEPGGSTSWFSSGPMINAVAGDEPLFAFSNRGGI